MGQTEQTKNAAEPKPSSQTASPAQPGQHRSGQARPQPSPAQPKPWCGPCQSSAKGFFLPDSDQAQPSSAQASPAHHAGQVSPAQAQLTNRKPSPARPQATAEPSPAQAVVWALPKLCQRLFLTGFRGAILGRRSAQFLLRFWPVWGRRAAAFRCLRGRLWGLVFGASPAQASEPSPAQPSPAQALVWALPKLCQSLFLPDSDVAF